MELVTLLIYWCIAGFICLGLGNALYRRGFHLLGFVFESRSHWVQPINTILLCGFYLVNAGISIIHFKQNEDLATAVERFEFLSWTVGSLLMIIGGMHLFNVLFFLILKWGYIEQQQKRN
jgi:hypothetical protein